MCWQFGVRMSNTRICWKSVCSQVTVVVNQVWYILVGTVFLALMMEVWLDTVRFPLETNVICVYSIADLFDQIDFILWESVQPATRYKAENDFELLVHLYPLPRSGNCRSAPLTPLYGVGDQTQSFIPDRQVLCTSSCSPSPWPDVFLWQKIVVCFIGLLPAFLYLLGAPSPSLTPVTINSYGSRHYSGSPWGAK